MFTNITSILINSHDYISAIEFGKSHKYLGMSFIPCSEMKDILLQNLNNRMHNIHKFYGWLEVNINTPIEVKLLVLYSGVFPALLYGVETWGDIELIKKYILSIEIKALKAVLNVKKGTWNDLVYHKLRRGNIFSKIKDQQWKFYQRLMKLKVDESSCIRLQNIQGNNLPNITEICMEVTTKMT